MRGTWYGPVVHEQIDKQAVTLTNLIVWRVHVGANSLEKLEGPDVVRPSGLVGWRFTLIQKKTTSKNSGDVC